MTAIKRRLIYSLVALLFLLVLALVGWLAYLLFTLRVVPPSPEPAPVAAVRQRDPGEGAFSETVIHVETPATPADEASGQDEEVPAGADAGGPPGPIPCVCEGYGPQIRGREAYPNPVTHQTAVSAARATVTLTIQPEAPRGEP